jgi:hypothetical protein
MLKNLYEEVLADENFVQYSKTLVGELYIKILGFGFISLFSTITSLLLKNINPSIFEPLLFCSTIAVSSSLLLFALLPKIIKIKNSKEIEEF